MLQASTVIVRAGVWLFAQIAATGDTLIMKQAPIDPGWFERTTQVLNLLLTVSIVALTVAVIPAAWNFRKSYQKISDLLDRVYADVNPIAHHASRIAENVDYVSTAIRGDVQRTSAMVAEAERRLNHAVSRAESRARELEALLDVAQDEVEDTFVTAAATVRGVRASVQSLGDALGDAMRPAPSVRTTRGEATVIATGDALDELALVDVHGAASAVSVPRDPRVDALLDPADDLFDEDLPYDDDDFDEDLPDAHDPASLDAPQRPRVRPRRGSRG